jgi:release factor glutamine methyltransferase
MTRRQALSHARKLLATNNIESASLEAELLLRHALKIDRIQLYTEPDQGLTPQQEETYRHCIERRLKGEPSAYIVGHREFFGLDFYVDKNVLIPRPETELLVEQVIVCSRKYSVPVIVDVGTGCGAIATSLALNLPNARIYATDVSEAAVNVARCNCQKHRVQDRISLLVGNMLKPLPESVDIIVANLPYVRTTNLPRVNTIGFEPCLALDGGADGLDIIHLLCIQAKDKLLSSGCLLMEIGIGQDTAVTNLLHDIFPQASIKIILDLSGIARVVCLTLPSY